MDNKKIVNASPTDFDGIHFKSRLEVLVYKTLKEAGLNPQYEPTTIVIWEGFRPTVPFYDKAKTGKMMLKMSKLIDIKYSPDFVVEYGKVRAYIEAKGFENDVFYIKNKLFRAWLEKQKDCLPLYFEVWSKKQTLQIIDIIKNYESQVTGNS